MENYKSDKKSSQSIGKTDSVNIPFSRIFQQTIKQWPWLLLSIFICCALGFLYLLHTPYTYSQSAVLVIKDDEEGRSVSKDLSQIGLFQNNSNLQNEVATLKSPDVIEDVVERLNLEYSYYLPNLFRKQIVYGKTLPVSVSAPGCSEKATVYFKLNVATNGDVEVSDFKVREKGVKTESDKVYKGKLNVPFQTFIGEMTVIPTAYYDKNKDVELDVEKWSKFGVIEYFTEHLNVEPDEDGGTIIKLTLTDPSVERADDVLSTLVKVYRENWIDEKNQMAIATSNFINERLNVIEKELGNVDSDISQFKSSHLLPNVEQAAETYMKQNQQLSEDILNLTSELQITRYLREYMAAPANQNSILPSTLGLTKTNYNTSIESYNAKLIERNNLAAKSSEKNPLVATMDADLEGMRNAIIKNIDNSIVTLSTQIRDLQGARGETREKISTNPTQAKYLLSVERQQKVKENLYLFLLQKREDNEIEQAFTAQNFRLIQRPGGSDIPIAPNKKAIMIGAFLLGCIIPLGYQYFRITTNTKVNDRSDCKQLSMPLLGEIPQYKGKEDAQTKILVRPAKRDVLNESFRVLRTNIDFVKPQSQKEAFTIAITSINPGSGKSFIAINIGTAIAIRNSRVLVIDTDLRRGSVSAYVNSPKKGLSDYLAGKTTDINQLIVRPDNDGPDVLPIGSIPPNPTELIESPLFGEMMLKLKEEYDYIICDCPPIDIVADTRIIDKYADRTVFVIRAGILDKAFIPEIENLHLTKQYTNMAYILNGTNYNGTYGKRYGAYGYGYGYGSAAYGEKHKKS